ncbi:MAG: tRNA (guanosine(37)-N1)-methyltransferase TrmD [Bacteroidia bacterium]
MRIDIISAVPDLMHSSFNHSILKRAINNKLVEVNLINLRDYAIEGKAKQIDDYAFGGGAGMVLMIEPIDKCISQLKNALQQSSGLNYDEVIYMSPDGELLNQKICNQFSLLKNIIILCGHYKGVDQRVREHLITREISIGDYVLSGGELPAAVLSDAVIRLLPGVLNDETSALSDSFQDNLLAPPVYSLPAEYKGWGIPPVLLSGHTANIEKWRHEQSVERTRLRRPDLLR